MKMAAAGAAGISLAGKAGAETTQEKGGNALARTWKAGEPYELLGKRMVFTNWYWIRPGVFGWYNDKGESVAVAGSEGPWGAHFRRSEFPTGIRLVAQPARRIGPILKPERPWEGDPGVNIVTAMQDGGIYRAWGGNEYFESKDGMNWERPELGLVEHGGSKKNNLLSTPVEGGATVFRDPSAPESERYKYVGICTISQQQFEEFKRKRPHDWDQRAVRPDAGHIYAISGAVSSDGINWTRLEEPLVVEHSDTQVTGYYDQRLAKYVVFTRNYMIGPTSPRAADEFHGWWAMARRSIGRTESADFRSFPLSQVIIEPGPQMPPYDLLYTNCYTTIPGAPDHHLMFPTVWHAAADDTTSVVLASSHDGRVWHFLPGGPVLDTAPFGEWDGGCVFANPNLIELPDGTFALPYTGWDLPHKYPRVRAKYRSGYAIWPKGRLVALEAVELGEFWTAIFFAPGRKMRINAEVRRGGRILVEVANQDHETLPGRSLEECVPIIGDQFRTIVAWKSGDDLGYADGSPIMLRFKLDRARLFGLDFE